LNSVPRDGVGAADEAAGEHDGLVDLLPREGQSPEDLGTVH
jgi:hypothetical protein